MKFKCGNARLLVIWAAALMPPAIVLAQAPTSPSAGTDTGGQLQQMTVTGYVIPRVGEGPQPVVSYDRDFIEKQANQTASDVLRSLPYANGTLSTFTNAGINSSPASAAVNLRGLGGQSYPDAGRWPSVSGFSNSIGCCILFCRPELYSVGCY